MWNASPQWTQMMCFECIPFGFWNFGGPQFCYFFNFCYLVMVFDYVGYHFFPREFIILVAGFLILHFFNVMSSMSGAMIFYCSSSLMYSLSCRVSLCPPETCLHRIQLSQESLSHSSASSGCEECLFVSRVSASYSFISSYWCFDIRPLELFYLLPYWIQLVHDMVWCDCLV